MARRGNLRKKTGRKAGKRAAGRRKATMANKDDHYFTAKSVTTLTPIQGLAVSNYLNVMFSPCPGTGLASYTAALTTNSEFALYRQMYDQFRILGVSIKVIPKYTVTDSSNLVTNTDNLFMSQGRGVYYTVIDRDGPVPSSISAIKKYASHKVHKITKSTTRSYNVKYDGKDQWLDCQDRNALDQIQKSLGLWGGISVYGESFPEASGTISNSAWADVEVSYRMAFRGKSLVGVAVTTVDGVEVVTLQQPDVTALDPVIVFKSNEEVPHFGAIDLSGNRIDE